MGQIIQNPSLGPIVYANSGSAVDIQLAINEAVIHGINDVVIPEGTWNFADEAPWPTVEYPAGINLFGAPTERVSGQPVPSRGMNPNGQVVEWKTILVMPYDVPGAFGQNPPWWFRIIGAGDPNKPSRFSDIKLIGYRSIDSNSITVHLGIEVRDIIDFRVDHVYFDNICGRGVGAYGLSCRGVIDHCILKNTHGHVEATAINCTVGYGVARGRASGDLWEDDISKVLGKYTDYTVFIEDCYFEKWRHCVASGHGAHYVFRYNTIKDDFGFGSLDVHGWGIMSNGVITGVGGRAVEIYGCEILDSIFRYWATMIRGGAGVAFNNTVGGGVYNSFIYMSRECQVEVSKCWPHDWWIWNNTLLAGVKEVTVYVSPEKGAPEEGIDYFLHAPHTFSYEPYPYPHRLVTGEEEPPPPPEDVTPWTGEREEGTYKVTMPSRVLVGENAYKFLYWEDGSLNPERHVNVPGITHITATYELTPPIPSDLKARVIVTASGLSVVAGILYAIFG